VSYSGGPFTDCIYAVGQVIHSFHFDPYVAAGTSEIATGVKDALVEQIASDASTNTPNALLTFQDATTSVARAVALDDKGNVYLAGQTDAPDRNGAAFALKLSADLSQVVWKVFFTSDGGRGPATGRGIAVSPDGNDVWLTGSLVRGGSNPGLAMLVAHLNGRNGNTIAAQTYRLGFTDVGDTEGYGIAVNGAGVYVAGYFFDDSTPAAGNQALAARFRPDLSLASALGVVNDGDDRATGIALDPDGNAHVTGFLNDGNPADPAQNDLLYGWFDPGLTTGYVYGFSGGDTSLVGNGIALDAANEPLLVGGTDDHVNPDVLVVRLSATPPAEEVLDQVQFGGSSADAGNGIVATADGTVHVGGDTSSDDFPTTPGVFQETYGGGPRDGFVARLQFR
jgi:hypothetical protein